MPPGTEQKVKAELTAGAVINFRRFIAVDRRDLTDIPDGIASGKKTAVVEVRHVTSLHIDICHTEPVDADLVMLGIFKIKRDRSRNSFQIHKTVAFRQTCFNPEKGKILALGHRVRLIVRKGFKHGQDQVRHILCVLVKNPLAEEHF